MSGEEQQDYKSSMFPFSLLDAMDKTLFVVIGIPKKDYELCCQSPVETYGVFQVWQNACERKRQLEESVVKENSWRIFHVMESTLRD